jgi:hypothetical protein
MAESALSILMISELTSDAETIREIQPAIDFGVQEAFRVTRAAVEDAQVKVARHFTHKTK